MTRITADLRAFGRYKGSKAQRRLLHALSEEQAVSYLVRGYFDIISNLGNSYRINWGYYIGNIYQVTAGGDPYGCICCHLKSFGRQPGSISPEQQYTEFPLEDHYLAQALMLRTDEDEFWRIKHSTHSL